MNEEKEIWQSWNYRDGFGYWNTEADAFLASDEDYPPVRFVPDAPNMNLPPSATFIADRWEFWTKTRAYHPSRLDSYEAGFREAERYYGIK